ncbi:hypothetical protein OIU34_18205 [Pararhizobium sp. BT-229]|uniref:hypothetical protein n=1 Tax=Pararhizobium sp. BT-229 TaxID=2986923 RepID=UPI0021F74DD0|nr:hypothetical protein [Pararhizobium sp. BT-229]MCV9963813.1 hypothetical protein [Pararhizobium sp. BT-229]
MQDNVKTNLDRAVAKINGLIKADILSCGEKNLSMAFLSNSFSSAIYKHVETVGTAGQLSILADASTHDVQLQTGQLDTRTVAAVIASATCEALMTRMRPKMIDMCRALHRDRVVETLSDIGAVLERACLENDPGLDHSELRAGASFATSVATAGLPADYAETLSFLPVAMRGLADRRKDKALISRLGEPLERLVRLADRAADLVHLNAVDPEAFMESVESELARPQVAAPSMAA